MNRVPTVTVELDGVELTGPEAAMIAVAVDIGAGLAVDAATIVLARQSPSVGIGPAAPVRIDLGYEGDNEVVLTGEVAAVAQQPWGVVVDVLALPGRLQRTRIGRSYLDQSPADIVSDLAFEADVAIGELVATDPLGAYHVDERLSAWRHVNDLARLAGGWVRTEPDGALSIVAVDPAAGGLGGVVAATASAVGDLLGLGGGWRFGAELVGASIVERTTNRAPDVVAHGAASPLGSDKWHLLLREPDGGAPDAATIVPGAMRTAAAASALADSLAARARKAGSGANVMTLGQPGVRPGDKITIADWPHGDPDPLEVRSVTHRLDPRSGFVSEIALVAP